MSKTFLFRQNNSGGSFTAPAKHVVVVAENEEIAYDKVQCRGLYFNGVAAGVDCQCCGDRWNAPSEFESVESAMEIVEYAESLGMTRQTETPVFTIIR